MIPIDDLHANPANIRADLGDLDELAASIRAVGLLQPLVVTPRPRGGWTVIDGHRRLAAARRAGAAALPCIAAKAAGGDQQVSLMLAAAMHKALDPLEQGEAFQALRNRGIGVAEIARRTGYSPSTISARLLLPGLPPEAQEMVRQGEVTLTEATKLARSGTGVKATPRPAWFTPRHQLAAKVRDLCAHKGIRVMVGGVGCGECWEYAIRDDARTEAAA